jgi:tetratricopeptide (TPR) repeat protein
VAAQAAVELEFVRLHLQPEITHEQVHRELDAAIEIFERFDDEAGLASAFGLRGTVLFWRGHCAEALEQLDRAVLHARCAEDRVQENLSLRYVLTVLVSGPTPVAAARSRVEEIQAEVTPSGLLQVALLRVRGELEAMEGRLDAGRDLVLQARALATELGLNLLLDASIPRVLAEIELLAGDPAAAEQVLRPACERLERIGDWGHLTSGVPYLVDALARQGRAEEVAPLLDAVAQRSIEDDMDAQIGLARAEAKILAHRGRFEDAERRARDAVADAEQTEYLDLRGRALWDLAEVLELAGRPADATEALEGALDAYERKGHVAMAERVRERLAGLRG